MTRAIIASLLCGAAALAVASCGGKGSYSSGYSGGSYQSPSGNSQAPPSNDQSPGTNEQGPGLNSQQPGGGGGFDCTSACSKLAASGCYEESFTECVTGCEEEVPEALAGSCGPQYRAFYDCLLNRAVITCTTDPETQSIDLDFVGCDDEIRGLIDCDDIGGGSCTPQDSCSGCSDSCDSCLCSTGGDQELCSNACSGGGACDYDQGICSACETACDACECAAGPDSVACDEACGRTGTGSCVAGVDCSACSVGSCEECLCLYDNDVVFCSEFCG